ncbi:hypothetical protein EUGRSUZ_H01405 [Eucalyptus grandis]|uniref:Uncharacterized protein n=2 Tax=Eucalyptus grandis TaxID=71139 RepID=A0ACC3JQ83_EUCGR|nr:hypothetical protein EUGRSUZ_H01405 [Eucalyptus grandis]
MKEEADAGAGAGGEGGRRGETSSSRPPSPQSRGYASAGVSIDSSSFSLPPLVFRQEGNIESLAKSVDARDLNLQESFLTHAGIPAPRNSHPQSSDAENEFLVVHNGVITNHEVLKQMLIRHGFKFESDTDTEVIPKLAKYVLINLMKIQELTEESSKGSLFHDDKYPSQNGNPRELFLSSDANALVEHTRTVLVIEEGEVVDLKDGGVSILKFDGDKGKRGVLSTPASVQRALSVLEMEVEQINKGSYEHYMQKEIHEQPESLTTTMRGRLIRGGTCKAKTVLLGIPVTMEIASDLLDRQGPIYREDTAVFVSQSGETVDTLHALEYALQNGALRLGITNTVCSAIASNTHCGGVHINAGAEIGVASTNTSQIVVMAMLALAIGGDAISNQVRREAIIDYKVREVLKLDQEMKYLAKLLIAEQSLLMFGTGYNYATDAAAISLWSMYRVLPIVFYACQDAASFFSYSILLAYHLTVLRGYNVNQPRNLAKSVTTD